MFRYSHTHNMGFLGSFNTPAEALAEGRRTYGDDTDIYLAETKQAFYSDFFPSVEILFADMKEAAAEELGDAASSSFDSITIAHRQQLDAFLRETIGEWETDLADAEMMDGFIIIKSRKFAEGSKAPNVDNWNKL